MWAPFHAGRVEPSDAGSLRQRRAGVQDLGGGRREGLKRVVTQTRSPLCHLPKRCLAPFYVGLPAAQS